MMKILNVIQKIECTLLGGALAGFIFGFLMKIVLKMH